MVCSGFTGTVYPGLGPGPSRGGPDPRPNGVGGTRLWCGAGGAGFPRDRGAIEVTGGMEKSWKNRGFHDENCCFLMAMSYVFFLPDHCFAMRKSFAEPRFQGFLGGVLRGL